MRSSVALRTLLLVAISCAPARRQTTTAIPPAAGEPSAQDAPLSIAIDAYVTAFGRTWGDPYAFSGYVAVARNGHLLFAKPYGQSDRTRGTLAGPDTRFRIGSITKPFTAIGILQLEQRGLLHLEDSVRKYLPELPAMADPVTLHHCLTHTSGLPPLSDDAALVAETGQPHPVASAFASYKDERLRFPPGARFEYSNAGFTVLAAILERVSGLSYEAYMREHVFGPAGMTRTTTVTRPSAPAEMAVGYDVDARGRISIAKEPADVLFGSGAIVSTANDLLAFDRALSSNLLLEEAAKRRMFAPERDVGGIVQLPSRYGLGWFVSEEAGHEVFWHPGGVEGFQASFARVPDAKLSVVHPGDRARGPHPDLPRTRDGLPMREVAGTTAATRAGRPSAARFMMATLSASTARRIGCSAAGCVTTRSSLRPLSSKAGAVMSRDRPSASTVGSATTPAARARRHALARELGASQRSLR